MKALTLTGFRSEPKSEAAASAAKRAFGSFVANHEKSLLAVFASFAFLAFIAAAGLESEALAAVLAIPAALAIAAMGIHDCLTRNTDEL